MVLRILSDPTVRNEMGKEVVRLYLDEKEPMLKYLPEFNNIKDTFLLG